MDNFVELGSIKLERVDQFTNLRRIIISNNNVSIKVNKLIANGNRANFGQHKELAGLYRMFGDADVSSLVTCSGPEMSIRYLTEGKSSQN